MADSLYQAATSAQRQELKAQLAKSYRVFIPSNDNGIGPTSYRAGFDVDGDGTALGNALADMGYAGSALSSNQSTVTDGGTISVSDQGGDYTDTSATVAVDSQSITGVTLSSSNHLTHSGDTLEVSDGPEIKFSVSNGDLSASITDGTWAEVPDSIDVEDAAGTSVSATLDSDLSKATLGDSDAIVSNGDTGEIDGAGVTVSVDDGSVSLALTNSTDAVVSSNDTVTVGNTVYTITVENGAITDIESSATSG